MKEKRGKTNVTVGHADYVGQTREQEINVNYNSDRKLVDLELKNGYHLATILCFLWLPKGNGKGAVN